MLDSIPVIGIGAMLEADKADLSRLHLSASEEERLRALLRLSQEDAFESLRKLYVETGGSRDVALALTTDGLLAEIAARVVMHDGGLVDSDLGPGEDVLNQALQRARDRVEAELGVQMARAVIQSQDLTP
jgi:hypothetical protein